MADTLEANSRSRRTQAWPVAYRWLATGTLVIYTAVGTQTLAIAQGAGVRSNTTATEAIGNLPSRKFEISAGALESVIGEFKAAAGVKVEIDRPAIGRVHSPGVTGTYTVEEALRRMLAGTGVTYRFRDGHVVLTLDEVRSTVEVSGRIEPTVTRSSAPLRDLPQTITVIPKSVIEEQSATTLRDVLRNVSGLTMTAGEGGAPAGDNLTLRGFSARNDIFVDGVRDLGPQSRDPFNLESVEVVKGPTSAYTGRGSAGGAINLVSKAPGLSPMYGLTFNGGTDGTRRFTADLNTPLAFAGERTAFRLNALGHESGVAGRDVVENSRWGIAPAVSLGLGTPTRMTFSYFKLKQDNIPDYGIPWVTANHNVLAEYRDKPAPVDRDNFYGLEARDREEMNSDLGTVRFEHDFSDTTGIRNQLRYGRSGRNSVTSAPRFASPDNLVINRNGPSWITSDRVWDNQTDVRGNFSTGRVDHSVVTGAAFTREHNLRQTRTVPAAPTTTLFNPTPGDPYNGAYTINPVAGDLTANSQSLYAFDTVKLHEKFQFNGGLRFDRFDVDGVNTTGVPTARVDQMLSVRGGAVYKPKRAGTFYVSYGTSMSPSLEGLSYQPANTTLEPEKTYTLEGGTKWDLFSDRLLLTAAVFRVTKTNARTPGATPDDPPVVLEGQQRVRGFEFGATGAIRRDLRLLANYTFLDSRIEDSNNAAEVGRRLINTPAHSVNVWATYSRRKLNIGLGPRFVGARYGNTTNTRRVGSYATLDAMVGYAIHRRVDLRFNLFNLNNAYYFDRLGGGHLIPGAGRSAMIGTNFRF